MEKIIERNVPIAEENVTLSGQPATNMFEDWSENITETDLLHEEKDKGLSPKKNPKKLVLYLQLIIPQYFISNKSGIWSLSLIVHSKG